MNAKLGLRENVQFRVYGANGKLKQLFQTHGWVSWLIKYGYLSPHHYKIPFLLGQWGDSMLTSNLIVNVGAAAVAQLLIDGAGSPFSHIAVGTGATAANATDTALQTETSTSGLGRAAATTSQVTTDVTNDTAQYLKSFSVTGTVAVTESGVFNNPSSGTPLCRQVFSAINVVNGDTLQITWKIDVD